MTEKGLVKKPTVTIAKIIKIKKKKPIFIPSEFVEMLKYEIREEGWTVMICISPCNAKLIRFIPTKSPTVIKVFIEWSQTEPNTLQELGVVYMRNKIKTLYSTAICFCGHIPPHPYEGYIDSSNLSISKDQLQSELLSLPNVTNVELIQYSL